MTNLQLLKGCELHVHTAGCLYPKDLLALGKEVYKEIDWAQYIESYQEAYGVHPEPLALFEAALANGHSGQQQFHEQIIFKQADAGDFDRFQAKFNRGHAQAIQAASGKGLTARYLISLPRAAPLAGYCLVQRLFDENPDLIPTIVGLDFCFFEEGYPPETVRPFFTRLHQDNQDRPHRALEVAYHVGESYFDKSLESAFRWCHEIAEMGAQRLGHAIALGLDPAAAISRRPQAHEAEPVSERLAQIMLCAGRLLHWF